MELTRRRIRASGRTTGSVEVTLPRELRALQGLECNVTVRDGEAPEIVLVPDLSPALAAIAGIWKALRQSLAAVEDIGDVPWGELELGLAPSALQPSSTPLSYLDVLTAANGHGPRPATVRERAVALSRIMAVLSVQAGLRLGLEPQHALLFGESLSYLCTTLTPARLPQRVAESIDRDVGRPTTMMDISKVVTVGRHGNKKGRSSRR